jgi:hypothetical protein
MVSFSVMQKHFIKYVFYMMVSRLSHIRRFEKAVKIGDLNFSYDMFLNFFWGRIDGSNFFTRA